ncbi:MAG: large extracellular alpha-helical protein [Candidatus Eremiobacteraeota bacterium]|nr:large extracellular alpha-helical protein [Candidatus Eremiobacteraeota bacterium]
MRMLARRVVTFAALAVALFATGCTQHAPAKTQPLPTVSPLPAPSPSGIIASVAPAGDVDTLAQIRVRFRDEVIPLARLESPDETAALAHFSIAPALPGRFRFLTPKMIGFEADKAWPAATRVRVTMTKGLRDTRGHELGDDVSWTFQTGGIEIDGLPGKEGDKAPRVLRPKIELTSNTPLDRASLESHAVVRATDKPNDPAIPLSIPPDTASPSPGATADVMPEEQYDPSLRSWRYVLVPAHDLEKATQYDVVIQPGVLPRDGNRPSEFVARGTFRTFDALRFDGVSVTKQNGARFTSGQPKLAFTTPIDEKSIGALALSPAPPRGSTPFAAFGEEGVAINTSLLSPQTDYTVTIGADLKDTFGQTLGTAQTATFRTGDYTPDVWAPSGTNLFPASRDVRLNVVAVNAPPDVRAIFRALHPADVVLYSDTNGSPERGDMLPPRDSWPHFDASGPKNVERTIEVPLRAKLGAPGGALAYGVFAQLPKREEPSVNAGVVQLTDLGAFAQWFPDSGTVRVNRIADGTPVAGAQVDVYPSQADSQSKSTAAVCATATTSPAGVATFTAAAFAKCAATDKGQNEAPPFVTIVRKGPDWSYVRTSEYSGAYSGDFYNGWSSATPIARGTIFSDRDLYQPGETAQLTAAGWFLVNGVLRSGVAPSYAITLEMPNDQKRDLGRRSLDAFGEFSIPVVLPKDAPLGYYTVRASAGNGEEIVGNFRVAEFKPPNFKVDLGLDHDIAARGGTVVGTATNAYLFGAPLTGASTKFTVTRSPASFTPKGRDQFRFGRQWYWPEQQPDASTDVLETTATVDDTGKSSVSVPVANDLPYPMAYQVDAETTDASNISVADGKLFTALPSDTLLGVKTDDVGTAARPLNIDVIATDPRGAARSGTNVHVELQNAVYTNATQIVEGAEEPVQSVSYTTVASADATTGDKAVSVALTPPKPGTYRVRANVAGAKDDAGATDVILFVGGSGEAAWFARDPNQLTVKLDKSKYKPGDVATALVQSPFADAELHVAVIRHGVLWETTQQTHGAAPTVRFTITPEMLPNAAVQAFLVRRGPPPPKDPADAGNALARTGFTPFNVALDGKYVTASVRADSGVLAPGAQQTVHVHLADRARNAVRGQATLMVVNEAVLRLTGYRPPDLVKSVYADQPISTRYADNRTALALKTIPRPVEKGWGFGGGLSGEDADPRVRRKFEPLAYFAGALKTDANGDATATFTLPDDLTTWRVMVVAATADARFGNGDTTFRTTKPLVANPVMPQFARPGDKFEGGVAVTNGTGAPGTLHVEASLAGPLAFLVNDKPSATTSLDTTLDKVTKAYRFPVVANGAGIATATIRVRGAGTSDAFAIPVPVRDLDVTEAVAQTGTTDSRATVGLNVAADTPRDAGGLDVALASSLIPEISVAAQKALIGDERLTISCASRLAIASDLVILAKRSGTDAKAARDRALLEISTLASLRRADGGFAAYWRAEGSDPWDSMLALTALARAHDAGISAADPLLAGVRTYASSVLADPTGHQKWCKSDLCKAQLRLHALDALAAAGDHRTAFLTEIYAQRDKLPFADQARLARLLATAPGFGAQAATLAKFVDDHLYETARGAAVSLPGRYNWFDDNVVAQAEALRLEVARNANGETIDRLTRSLLDMRRNGTFGCACENAAALGALVDLANREQPANFTATATLAGKTLVHESFSGAKSPQRTAKVPMRDLPTGRNEVALAKDGTGTLHYAVTYNYRLAGNAPGRLNGLRITRIVRAANTTPVLATMGLAALTSSLDFPAAKVYDVELQIVSDHPVERVLITDPLPAGFEAVDTSFATTSQALKTPATDWKIGDQQIHTDRIEAYADHLDAGIYRLHYLVRTVTPGTFAWPGANAHIVDRPDEFGRSATSVVVVH